MQISYKTNIIISNVISMLFYYEMGNTYIYTVFYNNYLQNYLLTFF